MHTPTAQSITGPHGLQKKVARSPTRGRVESPESIWRGRLMKGSVVTAAAALALTACGRTELAVQSAPPALAALGERATTTTSFTVPYPPLPSPCTGEILNGFVTFSVVETVVTDASGGTHLQADVTYSSTYTGTAGTTFAESGKARVHLNLPSSGVENFAGIYNSVITGSDGTAFLARERFVFVLDAGGVVRVDRNNVETNAYRCQRG